MSSIKELKLRDIVIIGMLAALCTISTIIKIPYGNGAMVHLGTAALYTFAILFGGIHAGFAGAIGSSFYDILLGFSPYTLWSFFIKGIAGFIAGSIAHSGQKKGKSITRNIIGCFAAAAWTLAGYLGAWTVVQGSFAAALTNIPSSLITSGVGLVVAIPLSTAIRSAMKRSGINIWQ